jgi:hypothetical protein
MLPKPWRLHQNDDNVAQAPGDFIKIMITLSKSVGDSLQKWGELPTAVSNENVKKIVAQKKKSN